MFHLVQLFAGDPISDHRSSGITGSLPHQPGAYLSGGELSSAPHGHGTSTFPAVATPQSPALAALKTLKYLGSQICVYLNCQKICCGAGVCFFLVLFSRQDLTTQPGGGLDCPLTCSHPAVAAPSCGTDFCCYFKVDKRLRRWRGG